MNKGLQLELSADERVQLERIRDRDALAYVRERAAALLKIADGATAAGLAAHGLLRRRRRQTIGEWYHRYKDEGIDGLRIRPGRGRKPAFSPSAREC